MKIYKECKYLSLLLLIFLLSNCYTQLDYKYHTLTMNKNTTIDDLRDMKYEVGKLLIKHTTKYDNEKGQSDKTYKPFDKQDKITIIGALKENMKNNFCKGKEPEGAEIMRIHFLTNIKRYEKMRVCKRCRSCGRRCTHCWDEPCMKDHYDVITNIIGTDKQKKDNVLFKYKIKYSRSREYERYSKKVDDLDEILEWQIRQFVEDFDNADE